MLLHVGFSPFTSIFSPFTIGDLISGIGEHLSSSVGVPKNRKINCPQFGKMLGFSTDFLKKPKELWTTHPIPG